MSGNTWVPSEWRQEIAQEIPTQLNAFDCGIFSLKVRYLNLMLLYFLVF